MKRSRCTYLFWIFFLILLAGCSSQGVNLTCPVSPELSTERPPERPRVVSSRFSLKNDFDAMIARELFPYSLASVKVISLKSGSTLYEMNPYLLMPAASLQKLFTAVTALSRLGPRHILETSVAVNRDKDTLYVKGCGDPLIKTDDLSILVDELAAVLSPGRRYKLVGDTGSFDGSYWGKGWMWDDEPDPEAMYLSPLTVNGNTVRVTVSPGRTASSPLKISITPSTRYVVIERTGETGKRGKHCAASITRPVGDRDNHIRVGGVLSPGCPSVSKRLTIWRPERYFLTLLAETLERDGIETEPPTLGTTPPDAVPLTSIRHSVSEIVAVMLKKSDNLCAENLLKYLAYAESGQRGSASKGAEIIKEYLRGKGIPTRHLEIADGSGVSRYNLTNSETITRLLAAAYGDRTIFPYLADALPLAGNNGTLAHRMRGTPAEGKVRAKTGTMRGISALAGYTFSADGEPLAFCMIMQNFVGSTRRIRKLQDRMAALLSSFSSGRKDDGGELCPKKNKDGATPVSSVRVR